MQRSHRIVLIEVDPLMRELAQRWLEEAGHSVVQSAPTTLGDDAADADLVMLDVASPRRADAQIAALQARRATPILLVSAGPASQQRALPGACPAARRGGHPSQAVHPW